MEDREGDESAVLDAATQCESCIKESIAALSAGQH
jgi:hypothetical protein